LAKPWRVHVPPSWSDGPASWPLATYRRTTRGPGAANTSIQRSVPCSLFCSFQQQTIFGNFSAAAWKWAK
jgi:hypothetical protein